MAEWSPRWLIARGACLGRGRGAGTRLETATSTVAAGPRLPAPSTACTESLTVAFAASFRSRRCICTRSPAFAAIGISSRASARPSSVTKKPRVPPGPSSRGVTHDTIASPAGRLRRRGLDEQSARGRGRPSVVRTELDREIRRTRPVLLAAVDEPVGKEPECELLAGSRPLRAGVVEDQEAVAEAGDAGRHDARVDRNTLPAVGIRG